MSEPIDILSNVSCTLNGRNFLEMCSEIYIVEDMSSAFPRAICRFQDPRAETQEISSGDQFTCTIQPKNGPPLSVKHLVHSAKPQFDDGGKRLHGMVCTVDEDFSKFLKRTTKAFDKKNTDDAIKEVYKDVGGSKKCEVSSGFKQASFTLPSLMPYEAIRKCGELSGTGSKGFFFCTHKDGGTANFKTMKDMASKGPKKKFTYNSAGSADPNTLGDPSVVFDLQYEGSPLSAQKQTNAQGLNFNPQYGKFEKNDKAGKGLSTPGLGVKAEEAKVGFPVINNIEQAKNDKRQSDRDQQNLNEYTSKLKILVPIATDIHVGDVIEIDSGSSTYFSDASPSNSASGKWLVVSLMHTVYLGGKDDAPGHTGRTLMHCVGKIS
jgi:hypothetical protein